MMKISLWFVPILQQKTWILSILLYHIKILLFRKNIMIIKFTNSINKIKNIFKEYTERIHIWKQKMLLKQLFHKELIEMEQELEKWKPIFIKAINNEISQLNRIAEHKHEKWLKCYPNLQQHIQRNYPKIVWIKINW